MIVIRKAIQISSGEERMISLAVKNNSTQTYYHRRIAILISKKYNNQEKSTMPTIKEMFTVKGEQLLKKIKELIAEGNVRKITIHDKDEKEIMSFPLTIGVVGAVLAPILAAVGALAALIGECTISVEREE